MFGDADEMRKGQNGSMLSDKVLAVKCTATFLKVAPIKQRRENERPGYRSAADLGDLTVHIAPTRIMLHGGQFTCSGGLALPEPAILLSLGPRPAV
jgi:hypothetical protein